MTSAETFYNSLNTYRDIDDLILRGESESEYLECKAPKSVRDFDRNLELKIEKIVSGFSNNRGGVFIFGVDTDNKSGVDILTQKSPIGAVTTLQKRVELKLPLMVHSPLDYKTKILRARPSDEKGILVVYVPQTTGDPVQCRDGKFYLRTGEETPEMPYEVIKRMFAGTTDADLEVVLDTKLTKINEKKEWTLSFSILNNSRAPGRSVLTMITVQNPGSCLSIIPDGLTDLSAVNEGSKVFSSRLSGLSYKALPTVIGGLRVIMNARKTKLNITAQIYAENMRAKIAVITIYITKGGVLRTQTSPHEYRY